MSFYFPDSSEYSRHVIFPGVEIATLACEKMMLSYVELQPGSIVEEHSHPHEQVGMVLEGAATFYIGDEERMLKKGDMYRIPGGIKHRVVVSPQGAKALDIFSPIREEYR
jgi:quercetin dioxygenase-like cupin family protein